LRILALRPDRYSDGRNRTLALIDVELTPDVRIYNLRLIENGHGQHRVFAPNAHGARVATFAPAFADELTKAAVAALGSGIANDQRGA
jgi:hypothetical protein